MIDGGGAFGIEQSVSGGDVHGGTEGGDIELDDVLDGKRGMDFDDAIIGRERLASHLETVGTEQKIASDKFASVVGGKRTVELQGIAGKFDEGFEREAVRTADF